MALVDGEPEKALRILDEAHHLASRKKLTIYVHTVMAQKDLIKMEFNKWKNLIKSNATLEEHITLVEMKEYIEEAVKARDLFSPSQRKI